MFLSLIAASALDTSRLSVGLTWGGTQVIRYENKVEEIDETHTYKLKFKVAAREEGGWHVQREGLLAQTVISGHTIDAKADEKGAKTDLWLSPDGALADLHPFDIGGFKMERFLHLWMPFGSPAEFALVAGQKESRVPFRGTMSFAISPAKTAGTRTYTMQYTEEHGRMRAMGKVIFDSKTGRLLYAKVKATNAIPIGGSDVVDATMEYRESNTTKPSE